MQFKSAVVIGAILVGLAMDAAACGESLYRIGRGTAYRVYSAPVPANILIYTESNTVRGMAEQLANSGHTVTVVDNDADMRALLASGRFEVFMGPFSTLERSHKAPSRTALLPIVSRDRDDRRAAKKRYGWTVKADASLNRYLAAVHRSLGSSGR